VGRKKGNPHQKTGNPIIPSSERRRQGIKQRKSSPKSPRHDIHVSKKKKKMRNWGPKRSYNDRGKGNRKFFCKKKKKTGQIRVGEWPHGFTLKAQV